MCLHANKNITLLVNSTYQYINSMENSLLTTARSYFNDQVFDNLAAKHGESSDNVRKGLDAVIPSLFLGLQSKSPSEQSGIFDVLKQYFSQINFSDLGSVWNRVDNDPADAEKGSHLVSSIFGGELGQVIATISGFLHTNGSSVMQLFKTALPGVIGALTKNGTDWDTSRISGLLDNNKSDFLAALPSGLNLGVLGSSLLSQPGVVEGRPVTPPSEREPIVDPVRDVVVDDPIVPPVTRMENRAEDRPVAHIREEERKKGGGLWWLLIPLLLLLLWFLFGKGCSRENETATTDTIPSTVAPVDTIVDTVTTAPVRESIMVTLPDNSTLNAYKGGIEDQLVAFLNSDYKQFSDDQLKDRWFDFDNLNFETGTSTITADSQTQLQNLAAILKVYPDVKVKIGGYTDKTGDEAFNLKLSGERADAVKAELDKMGVGDRVVDTEGYGSSLAKYEANAPESDRIKDRRVSISVRK